MRLVVYRSIFIVIFVLFTLFSEGQPIRCYECVARLGPSDSSPCLYGDERQLRRVHCMGPSVCAAYHYQTIIPGAPPIDHITRGCQALRYGATCEDIFHQLRARNEILPGHHTCTTCSSDLCNSSSKMYSLWLPVLLFYFIFKSLIVDFLDFL